MAIYLLMTLSGASICFNVVFIVNNDVVGEDLENDDEGGEDHTPCKTQLLFFFFIKSNLPFFNNKQKIICQP